jgi:hypothetical protein
MANLERLIDKFTLNESPYFLIVDGLNTCIGKNTKHAGIDDAADRLKSFLEELDGDSKTVFKIYCYETLPTGKLNEEVKKIITRGDHDYLLTYNAFTPKERPTPIVNVDAQEARTQWKYDRLKFEDEMRQQMADLRALLLQREMQEAEETEEDIEQEMQPNNIVGALVGNPAIQTAIATGVVNLLGNFLKPNGQPTAVAGVPEDHTPVDESEERIFAAIDRLKKYDDNLPEHLEKLANMAEKNTQQFLGLLKFL